MLPNGRILSWSEHEKTLQLWDVAAGTCYAVLEGHTGAILGALVLPDGRILSRSEDATLRAWDSATGDCSDVLRGHEGWISGALALPDGRILSWCDDGTLRLWDVAAGTCPVPSTMAIVLGFLSVLWKWPKAVRTVLELDVRRVKGALVLPDGCILSWAHKDFSRKERDNTLCRWDPATGTCLTVFEGHWREVDVALALPNGRILSCARGESRLWDVASGACLGIKLGPSWIVTGTCLAALEGHTGMINGALALREGRILSYSVDGTLRVWDATTGACLAVLDGHMHGSWGIWGALELPDGRILSWAWRDTALRLWDVASGACLGVMVGHTDKIADALILPDGRIVSWSDDKTLRLWDAATGACLEMIPVSDLPVYDRELFHYLCSVQRPKSVADAWRAEARGRTAQLVHRLEFTSLPGWQAESDCEAHLLQPDGTLVVTQANGQVCILKLHNGNRRVTLAEAEEILRAGG